MFEPTPIESVPFPARRHSVTFTHPTAGDLVFTWMARKAAREYFEADPDGTLDRFTASNGVEIEVRVHEHDPGIGEEPVRVSIEGVLCSECGLPTMHVGNICYACSQRAKPEDSKPQQKPLRRIPLSVRLFLYTRMVITAIAAVRRATARTYAEGDKLVLDASVRLEGSTAAMADLMTLKQARDQIHAFATAAARTDDPRSHYVTMNVLLMDDWWKAIDAELARQFKVSDEDVRTACRAFDPIGWEVCGGDSLSDFKASMRAALTTVLHNRPAQEKAIPEWQRKCPDFPNCPSLSCRCDPHFNQARSEIKAQEKAAPVAYRIGEGGKQAWSYYSALSITPGAHIDAGLIVEPLYTTPPAERVRVPADVAKLLRDVRAEYIGRERPSGDGCDAETWDRIESMLSAAPEGSNHG